MSIHRKPRVLLEVDDLGRPITHGGSGAGYVRGCRCEECTEANRVRCLRRREERLALILANPELATHGKYTTYVNWGCRCDPCREAHRKHMKSPQHKETVKRYLERKQEAAK